MNASIVSPECLNEASPAESLAARAEQPNNVS